MNNVNFRFLRFLKNALSCCLSQSTSKVKGKSHGSSWLVSLALKQQKQSGLVPQWMTDGGGEASTVPLWKEPFHYLSDNKFFSRTYG